MEEDWDNETTETGCCFHEELNVYNSRERDHQDRSRERSKNTFEIEGNQVGAFIGKGGSNIRNYEATKFNVKLNLDKTSNTVTVTGEPNDISEACSLYIQTDLSNMPSRPRRDPDFNSKRNGG